MTTRTIEVNITGNAEGKLDNISKGLSRVSKSAEALEGSSKKGGSALDDIANSSRVSMFSNMSTQIESMGSKFEAVTSSMRGHSEEFVKDVIKDAATFEDAQSEMRFAFGSEWKSVYAEVKADAANLSFTFEQTSRLASSLGRMKINPFGGTDAESQIFKSKTGENIRALQVLQDTADAVGKTADDVVVGVRNAMSGSWKSLQDRFDIPKVQIAKWKGEIDKLATPQEKYNKLVQELSLIYGGAGFEKAMNWNKAMEQIPDLIQQIRAGAGMEGLKLMSASLRDFGKALASIANDKDVMKSLSDGFMILAKGMATGIDLGTKVVIWIRDLVKQMPWLPQVAVALGAITIAFTTLAGGAIAITTAIAGGVAAFSALGIGLGTVLGAAAAVLPIILLVGAGLASMALFAKGAADIVKDNWGGVGDTFAKVEVVLRSLGEFFKTYNGQTAELSTQTAADLEKLGLTGFATGIMSNLHKLNTAWNTFLDTLDDMGEILAPVLIPLLKEVGDLFLELGDALGITDGLTKANNGSAEDWAATAHDLAAGLMKVVTGITQVIRFGVAISRVTIQFWHMKEVVSGVVTYYEKMISFWKWIIENGGKVAKFLHIGGADKTQQASDIHKKKTGFSLWEEGPEVPADINDPFKKRRRMAGQKFRDDQGNFVPLKDDSDYNMLSPAEQVKLMRDSGKGDQLKEMAAGREFHEAKKGPDFQQLYNAGQGLVNNASTPGDKAERQAVVDASQGRETEADKKVLAEMSVNHLKDIVTLMQQDKVINISMNEEVILKAFQNAQTKVAGH